MTKLGGPVLLVLVIASLLASFVGPGLVSAQDASLVRTLPALAMPGAGLI